MKTRILTLSLFFAGSLASSFAGHPIFNGKDLEGWDGNSDLWRVEDGVIVGETTAEKKTDGNTFLIWQLAELGDFTLTLKARVTGKNNSGVQYRSKIVDPAKWVVAGYQMDMHPSPNYIGMLYEEKGRGITAQRGQQVMVDQAGTKHVIGATDKSEAIDLSQWNDYRIKARGNRIEHYVNNKLTSRIIDNDTAKRSMGGVLALQLHAGAPMRAEFKDLRLRNTPPKGSKPIMKAAPVPEWIWTSKPAKTGTIYARRQFTLNEQARSGKLTITCDNGFVVYINGQKLGGGDEWSNKYEFDVKKFLRRGGQRARCRGEQRGFDGGARGESRLHRRARYQFLDPDR